MSSKAKLIQEYLTLTRDVMPSMAKQKQVEQGKENTIAWPVIHDHCFQRIVLDNICEDAWYEYIKSPAYKHLNANQAKAAVLLCRQIIDGQVDLTQLNEYSLKWRQKQHTFSF
ncbi:hypothetical protein [Glaciecola sp. SC05]|uniref:hypothetical protein n=1 Tax=Glaciecola sp. SC05 TaxID=1987355 RepID=UPI00352806F2